MKPSRWFTRSNSVRTHLRIATAVALSSAAVAVALVTVNKAGPSLPGKTAEKRQTELGAASLPNKAFANRLKTLLGRANSKGEASPIDGIAQEEYDNRAYPSMWISAHQRRNARASASAILSGANTSVSPLAAQVVSAWQPLGPNGVPASSLVANDSTAGTSPTIFSGRATAIAVHPSCTQSSCTVFIGA